LPKWADYGISKVKYDDKHKHIVEVKRLKDLGENFGPEESWSRVSVINDINNNITYTTIVMKDNKWTKGAKVIVEAVNGYYYIKTVPDNTETDNLGNLEEYR
jgi:hypothetical protein